MGEKPLGIDEAPAQLGTIAGGAPLGGVDVPPPGMAANTVNTTRDNIRNSGSVATQLPKGLEPTPTRPGDPFPDMPGPARSALKAQGARVDGGAVGGVGQTADPVAMEGDPIPGLDMKLGKNPGGSASAAVPGAEVDDTPDGDELDPMAGAAGIITTRSNIKHSGSAAAATQLPKGLEPTPTRPGDPVPDQPGPAEIAVKEQGVGVDGGAAGTEGVGQTAEPMAMEGEPNPGIDVKLSKNPGGAAFAAVPGAEVGDTPDGDELDPMSGAAGVVTTRSNIKNGGSMTSAGTSGATPGGDTPSPPPGLGGDGSVDQEGIAATGINTTRSNIKHAGSVADAGSGPEGSDTDPPPGIAIKEQGVKYGEEGGAAASGDATEVAGGSEPIPGVDIIVKKNTGKD